MMTIQGLWWQQSPQFDLLCNSRVTCGAVSHVTDWLVDLISQFVIQKALYKLGWIFDNGDKHREYSTIQQGDIHRAFVLQKDLFGIVIIKPLPIQVCWSWWNALSAFLLFCEKRERIGLNLICAKCLVCAFWKGWKDILVSGNRVKSEIKEEQSSEYHIYHSNVLLSYSASVGL